MDHPCKQTFRPPFRPVSWARSNSLFPSGILLSSKLRLRPRATPAEAAGMAEKETSNPMEGLPEPPAVSVKTLAVTGIMVDVYGLEELPPSLTHVSVLWLHNPRLGTKARMAPMAQRAVGEYNATRPAASTRGLIAAAFGEQPPTYPHPTRIHGLDLFLT